MQIEVGKIYKSGQSTLNEYQVIEISTDDVPYPVKAKNRFNGDVQTFTREGHFQEGITTGVMNLQHIVEDAKQEVQETLSSADQASIDEVFPVKEPGTIRVTSDIPDVYRVLHDVVELMCKLNPMQREACIAFLEMYQYGDAL